MDILFWRTLLGLLLVILPIYVFFALKVKTLGTSLVVLLRMIIQMGLAGLYMHMLMLADSSLLNIMWLVLMTGLTAWMMVKRARLTTRLALLPVWGGVFVSVLLITLYLLLLVLHVEHLLYTQWLVPVSGILMAGITEAVTLGLREYFVGMVRFSDHYYYQLGNGASWLQAISPILKRAFERAFMRDFSRTAVMGFAVLPILFCALMMMGVDPLKAAVVTVVMAVATWATAVLTLILVVVISRGVIMDKRGKLTDNSVRLLAHSKRNS